jgi:hypothetical protein
LGVAAFGTDQGQQTGIDRAGHSPTHAHVRTQNPLDQRDHVTMLKD